MSLFANPDLRRGEIAYYPTWRSELGLAITNACIRDTSQVSEQLHVDGLQALQSIIDQHLSFLPIRISTFEALGDQLKDIGALLSLFASLGYLAVRRRAPPEVQNSATPHTAEMPQASPANLALECDFCPASIPLADVLALVTSRDRAQCTANLLAALAMRHAAECPGRTGAHILRKEDVSSPVAEGCTSLGAVIEGMH